MTKVLFCGREFLEGWNQTLLAVENAGLSDVIDVVRCERADVAREIRDAHVAVPLMTRLDAATLRGARALQMALQFGVGLEGVDEDACVESGIVLARIPSEHTGNAASTAEMAIYLTLAAMRRVWAMRESVYDTKTLGSPMGATARGKRVLVIGWGSVGKTVAAMLAPFGCSVSAARRSAWTFPKLGEGVDALERALAGKHVCFGVGSGAVKSSSASDDGDENENENASAEPDSLFAGLRDAHVVILACTQTAENAGMVDDAFLDAARDGCVLVNVARGGLFQPDAVLRALDGKTKRKRKRKRKSSPSSPRTSRGKSRRIRRTRSSRTPGRTSHRTWAASRTSRTGAWARSCVTSRGRCTRRGASRFSRSTSARARP